MKYGSYAQDHAPLDQQNSLEGHAVRAVFFATGVAELALENSTGPYRVAARRYWENLTGRRMYLTGSIGPRAENEAIGEDYELPVNGYNESCAACGLAAFAQRMFLLERSSAPVDVLERVLYNAVLHGIALDGCHSYYQNPLTDRDRSRDNNWTCCPPNLSRTLLNVGRYAYASSAREAYILLYVGGTAAFPLPNGELRIDTKTDYPWDGKVEIVVRSTPAGSAAINLRRPDWCPGLTIKRNGRSLPTPVAKESGFIRIDDVKPGDRLELEMGIPIVRVQAHPKIRDCQGRIALQRGPVIYSLEGLDNGGQSDIELGPDTDLVYEYKAELLGGVGVIRGKSASGAPFLANPCYALANRGKSSGQVWLRQPGQAQEAEPGSAALYRTLRN
jgi:DUF1680 family protein